MNPWMPIMRLARNSLIVLGVIVCLSAIAVFSLRYLADEAQSSLGQLQAAEQEQQAQLASKREDLLNMNQNITNYKQLQEQGFVGVPDRTNWVEELQGSYSRAGLSGKLVYRLQTPVAWAPSGSEPPPMAADGTSGLPAEPQIHELEFELQDVHELELLNLIRDYRTRVKGRFRVQSCKMQEPKDTGLKSQCVLRFLTIPASQVAG